jgi:hypothetical protein
MPTKFGKTMKMTQGDTACDLTSSVEGERKCERFMNIHHPSADSIFSNEHENSAKWATVHNYKRHMGYAAKTYIY